jgi:valyl-tRNA synthetase
VTPYLSEALHQKVYRKLDATLPESVNFEDWPESDEKLRNESLEEDFQTLFKCVSLVYSARQSAGLKRRWPLSKLVVVAPEKERTTVKSVEELFLELANVKAADYVTGKVPQHATSEGWVSASDGDVQIVLDVRRDERLLGAGLMRDLARRVQALRKELGYVPTDILRAVYMSDLDDESIRLLQPYLPEMKELVRAETVHLQGSRVGKKMEWHESLLDEKKVSIAICPKKVKRSS